MGFYDRYIKTVTKNDERTRSSVDSIMGRMDKLLNDPDEECHVTGRISGLVVGRVQSGKTRNYVGLALKAADAGWNVIIVLTSAITALAKQTEDRIMLDFENSDVLPNMANRLNLLDDAFNGNAKILEKPCPFFFWGVAMKERASLGRIKKWMDDNKRYAPHIRVLLIDDEADNATPNSNAGKDVVAEDPKDIVEDVATTMRECRADNYDDLADWLEGLLEYNPPDEAANTAEAKTYKALRECVAGAGSAKSKKTKILGNATFIALLGLDQPAAENGSADGTWKNGAIGEPLHLKADTFFSGKNYEPCRKASDFINVLKAVLQIAQDRSTINKAIISIVDKPNKDAPYTYPFARCAYIAYTATPYACILNERPDQTDLYADFIATIEKSPKYFGLDEIYGRNLKDAKARMDIIRAIPDDEESSTDEKDMIIDPLVNTSGGASSKTSNAHKVRVKEDLTCIFDGHRTIVWQSLKDAVAWSFCCAAARRWHRLTIDVPAMKAEITDANELEKKLKEIDLRWTTMLFNIHQTTAVHAKTEEILEAYLDFLFKDGQNVTAFIADCKRMWENETARFDVTKFNALFNKDGYDASGSYGEIQPAPSWNEIKDNLSYFFNKTNRHVIIINNTNKKNQAFYTQAKEKEVTQLAEDHLWFICGGNTISRGLTLAGLVASYFDRVRKSVAVDTMTQMGRWFGYRIGYELLPRVWMTPESVAAMKDVAVIEDRMHASIKENFDQGFSPSDQEHYQLVYCCGRRLTGRDKAKRRRDIGIGTSGYTSYLSVVKDEVAKFNERVERFIGLLQKDYPLSPEEQAQREANCLYGRYTLWRKVPKGEVVHFLKDAAALSPEGSKMTLNALVDEIENSKRISWNVVIANDKIEKGKEALCKKIGGVSYRLGAPNPTSIVNGVAHYSSPHLYLPFYADIPTKALNEVDYHFLKELLTGYIIPNLKPPLPDAIKSALAPYSSDKADFTEEMKERFGKLLAANDKPPYETEFPKGLREVFKGKKGGYNTRVSSDYMARVFDTAKDHTPILEFYFIKPPMEGLPPLTAISFHWPKHEPERFIAYSAGLSARPEPPTRARFYEAVEEVLADYDFPMQTAMLRSTIMAKLSPGCTESFFNSHIAQIPEGRNYEPVPKREAYMRKGWGGKAGIEARLDSEMLAAAIAMLQKDGKEHKMSDIFKETLTSSDRLKPLFNAGDSKAKARFNALITPKVMAENNIVKTCGRPVTWQYQG